MSHAAAAASCAVKSAGNAHHHEVLHDDLESWTTYCIGFYAFRADFRMAGRNFEALIKGHSVRYLNAEPACIQGGLCCAMAGHDSPQM